MNMSLFMISAELLEDIEDNNEASITLSMKARGFAHLTINEPDFAWSRDNSIASFELSPDANGIANAKVIAQALLDWVEQIRLVAQECKAVASAPTVDVKKK
jgi:hypothetical protein